MKEIQATTNEKQLSLNDDRRVRVLSPGAMVMQRFLRNRTAVTGLVVLVIMFLFSFVGGIISPYTEAEVFYTTKIQNKEFARTTLNEEYRYAATDGVTYDAMLQAKTVLAITSGKDTFEYKKITYDLVKIGSDFYAICLSGGKDPIAIAYKDVISSSSQDVHIGFQLRYDALCAYANGSNTFVSEGVDYDIDGVGVVSTGGKEVFYISRYVTHPVGSDAFLSRDFKEKLIEALDTDDENFVYTDENGVTSEYTINYDASAKAWLIMQGTETRVIDSYAAPSKDHWLGTDKNGMDMLTRLMYGGRVSLMIGFIVVIIECALGIVMGGLAGYFGGAIDMLIMRIVEVFFCIPSTPVIIILGAAMDELRVDSQLRMIFLMLLLGVLGWPGVARVVRAQILSLREQEFMTATEACGIRVSRRIFKHLIPNVVPQLIVICTMGLGSTILTEATLSFLGLGVKFPFASWGNIINDVNDTYVLTHYWFIWIPAGICLLLTVLAFNLVGDGLRDAFDPKMKR